MRAFLEAKGFRNIDFIYNEGYAFENYIIAGTRGWNFEEEAHDEKILNRELCRLEASIKNALEKAGNIDGKEIIVFMHYPPITKAKINNQEETKFIEIMKKYNVKKCYYGHLHGVSIKEAFEGELDGIQFKLTSADSLNFKLHKI